MNELALKCLLLLLAVCQRLLAHPAAAPANQTKPPQTISSYQGTGELTVAARCEQLSSCLARDTGLPESAEQACYCDSKCALYADCCRDSNYTLGQPAAGQQVHARRHSWYCLPVNEAFGSVLVKASCDARLAPHDKLVARRCSYLGWLTKRIAATAEQRREYFADPVGMMLPITDLATGITYANSYCLRCNRLGPRPRLQYWQALLECNYLLDVDDRNALFDHISAHQGQALEFSDARGQWIVKPPPVPSTTTEQPPTTLAWAPTATNQTTTASSAAVERSCQVLPTAPEPAEHLLRYCHYPTDSIIDTCPPQSARAGAGPPNSLAEARRQRLECQSGAQRLVYSADGARLYLNPACAHCNREPSPVCKPYVQSRHRSPLFVVKTVQQDSVASRGGQGGPGSGTGLSGSFSLLMDISGRSQADNTVGQVQQCQDAERQIFDPFYLACRDIVCGFKAAFNGTGCEQLPDAQTADRIQFRLVDKFNDTMSLVSATGLLLSVLALSLFLLLHWLSMFDLRSLLIKMAQAQAGGPRPGSPLERQRGSKTSTSSTAARESLSSRGVACLAGSLLLAYLLFLAGHQQLWPPTGWQCLGLAGATYGAFLLAFNWMFLLSYDIWRTLRLATCRLRVPAAHAQSLRFLCYALLALLPAGCLVALALALDLAGPTTLTECSQPLPAQEPTWHWPLLQYKPNFGKRPGSCWFANRRALALFFGAPITLITVLNFLFFLHSSCMVVRTSSRSSRRQQPHLSASLVKHAPQPPPPPARKNSHSSQDSFNDSSATATTTATCASSSISYIATTPATGSPDGLLLDSSASAGSNRKRAALQASNSSSSLTNQSLGGVSLATSLANKCDSQMQHLQSLASSLAKDYRLYCRLSTIMGVTWLTGLLASLVDQPGLWYLFVVLNTLQGLFIFIAFGCKRAKLHNLLILFAYLRFKSLRLAARPLEASPAEAAAVGPVEHKCGSLHKPPPAAHNNH